MQGAQMTEYGVHYGAAFDGRHVIFAPRDDSNGYHSRIALRHAGSIQRRGCMVGVRRGPTPFSSGAAYDGQHVLRPGYESIPANP